jgi:predicted RNase H-like HicB family nuclease
MMIPEGFFRPGEEEDAVDPEATEVDCGYVAGYRVVFSRYRDTWSADSPDLRGVFAGGATREEAERRMREAIPFHLEGLARDARSGAA